MAAHHEGSPADVSGKELSFPPRIPSKPEGWTETEEAIYKAGRDKAGLPSDPGSIEYAFGGRKLQRAIAEDDATIVGQASAEINGSGNRNVAGALGKITEVAQIVPVTEAAPAPTDAGPATPAE